MRIQVLVGPCGPSWLPHPPRLMGLEMLHISLWPGEPSFVPVTLYPQRRPTATPLLRRLKALVAPLTHLPNGQLRGVAERLSWFQFLHSCACAPSSAQLEAWTSDWPFEWRLGQDLAGVATASTRSQSLALTRCIATLSTTKRGASRHSSLEAETSPQTSR